MCGQRCDVVDGKSDFCASVKTNTKDTRLQVCFQGKNGFICRANICFLFSKDFARLSIAFLDTRFSPAATINGKLLVGCSQYHKIHSQYAPLL
jgi:hypothetical protein